MKVGKFLLNCIKSVLGIILLLIMIVIWALLLWFTTAIAIVEYIEEKVSNLMYKCYGEL
tara:strand:- start:1187 stop:1363 length:177 start_codon:yes stop_codon:yes gene_type:complete